MIQAKGINANDRSFISLGVVVVFVFFAFLKTLERQTERCQKGIRPSTLFCIAEALSGRAGVIAKQAGPVAWLC